MTKTATTYYTLETVLRRHGESPADLYRAHLPVGIGDRALPDPETAPKEAQHVLSTILLGLMGAAVQLTSEGFFKPREPEEDGSYVEILRNPRIE